MPRSCLALVLAAGEGTRMRSSIPKVMHQVAGTPMLHHVLEVSAKAGCNDIAVVVGNGAEMVTAFIGEKNAQASVFEQTQCLGTAHAVLAAREVLEKRPDDVLILFGDTPLVTTQTLEAMRTQLAKGVAVCVVGFRAEDPTGYGRLLEEDGRLLAIREHRDASEKEREIDFCNGGIMGLAGSNALELLEAIGNDNANGEFYLTDVVGVANQKGLAVSAIEASETEAMGVNTKEGLAEVEALWQIRRRQEMLLSGVAMTAPETVFFSWDTEIEADVLIEPNVVFAPGVRVKKGARIRAFSHLEGADIGENAEIGPYARLRPGTQLGPGTKVGNFVEIKKATIASGAKVNHLSYIGDAEIGEKANIGAGTITCNYDGINKHLTKIGAGAFIGSNSALVAPVTIGNGAYIASGSVIDSDVPDDSLGIARGKQANKSGYAAKIRDRNAKIKAERAARKS